jgi:Heterokaryon incompatibility protein (HET)
MASITYLCLICRHGAHKTAECPQWISGLNGLQQEWSPWREEARLNSLHAESYLSCARCDAYNILQVFESQTVRDESWRIKDNSAESRNRAFRALGDYAKSNRNQDLRLGPFREIVLSDRCPLCRLIFRVFPHVDMSDMSDTAVYYLKPFLSYDRQSDNLRDVSPELKAQYAIHFAVESDRQLLQNLNTRELGSDIYTRFGKSFGLSSESAGVTRTALRVRRVNGQINLDLLKNWIEKCISTHEQCKSEWSNEMLICSMIDVQNLQIVSCPPNCEYLALSYVWGGVQPKEGALEKDELPKTIKDAIAVTRGLDIKYLWVCQSNPASPMHQLANAPFPRIGGLSLY